MQIKKNRISRKEKVLTLFNKLYFEHSKKLTAGELLQVAEDIITATYKSLPSSSVYGVSAGISDYFTRDAFQMISENPWEIAVRESEIDSFCEPKQFQMRRFLWKK